jgi:hypothetical protein
VALRVREFLSRASRARFATLEQQMAGYWELDVQEALNAPIRPDDTHNVGTLRPTEADPSQRTAHVDVHDLRPAVQLDSGTVTTCRPGAVRKRYLQSSAGSITLVPQDVHEAVGIDAGNIDIAVSVEIGGHRRCRQEP